MQRLQYSLLMSLLLTFQQAHAQESQNTDAYLTQCSKKVLAMEAGCLMAAKNVFVESLTNAKDQVQPYMTQGGEKGSAQGAILVGIPTIALFGGPAMALGGAYAQITNTSTSVTEKEKAIDAGIREGLITVTNNGLLLGSMLGKKIGELAGAGRAMLEGIVYSAQKGYQDGIKKGQNIDLKSSYGQLGENLIINSFVASQLFVPIVFTYKKIRG